MAGGSWQLLDGRCLGGLTAHNRQWHGHPPAADEAALQAHNHKEKALSEVQALKLQAEREHANCEEEWRQLTAIIEDDK